MPLLNRFARPPRSWSIPRDPDGVADAVRFAEERDPVGTSVHLVLAMVFCASIALSTTLRPLACGLLAGLEVWRESPAWT